MPDPREIRVARMAAHATMEHLRPQLPPRFDFTAATLCRIADEAQAAITASDLKFGHGTAHEQAVSPMTDDDGLDFGHEDWTPGLGHVSPVPPKSVAPPSSIGTLMLGPDGVGA